MSSHASMIGTNCHKSRAYFHHIKRKNDNSTGLFRSHHDRGRSGIFGALPHTGNTKRGGRFKSRCPPDCKFCGGTEPGCLPGERKARNQRSYERSVLHAQTRMIESNRLSMTKLSIARTLACMFYFKSIMLGTTLTGNSFCMYLIPDVLVSQNPYYGLRAVMFQNLISSEPFLTYQREPRCVVLSCRQSRNLMCIGGISHFLARQFTHPSFSPYCIKHIRQCILKQLFSYRSIRRLVKRGGLNYEMILMIQRNVLEFYSSY